MKYLIFLIFLFTTQAKTENNRNYPLIKTLKKDCWEILTPDHFKNESLVVYKYVLNMSKINNNRKNYNIIINIRSANEMRDLENLIKYHFTNKYYIKNIDYELVKKGRINWIKPQKKTNYKNQDNYFYSYIFELKNSFNESHLVFCIKKTEDLKHIIIKVDEQDTVKNKQIRQDKSKGKPIDQGRPKDKPIQQDKFKDRPNKHWKPRPHRDNHSHRDKYNHRDKYDHRRQRYYDYDKNYKYENYYYFGINDFGICLGTIASLIWIILFILYFTANRKRKVTQTNSSDQQYTNI